MRTASLNSCTAGGRATAIQVKVRCEGLRHLEKSLVRVEANSGPSLSLLIIALGVIKGQEPQGNTDVLLLNSTKPYYKRESCLC